MCRSWRRGSWRPKPRPGRAVLTEHFQCGRRSAPARSIRRRRCSGEGKNDPLRSFGIFNSTSACVVNGRWSDAVTPAAASAQAGTRTSRTPPVELLVHQGDVRDGPPFCVGSRRGPAPCVADSVAGARIMAVGDFRARWCGVCRVSLRATESLLLVHSGCGDLRAGHECFITRDRRTRRPRSPRPRTCRPR